MHRDDQRRSLVIVEPEAALLRYARVAHRRFHTIVLTANSRKCLVREQRFNASLDLLEESHIDQIIECDVSDIQEMHRALVLSHRDIAGIVAGDDTQVPSAAALGRKFSFDYALPEDAIAQRVKTHMKLRFRDHQVPTPRFFIAHSEMEAEEAWRALGRDCMVKMVDLQASINIFKVTTRDQLTHAWNAIIHNSGNLKLPARRVLEVIVEEYAPGRELTVEGYVEGDRVVCLNCCEKITDNFVVVGHLLPAVVTDEEAQILRTTAKQCVKALGIRNSVFHVEIHLNGLVPNVIECASRPPGAHSVEMMYRTYGFDLTEISIALATGEAVTVLPTQPRLYYAMLALYSHRAGVLASVEGLDELIGRGGVARSYLGVKPGDQIHSLAGTHQDGFVIIEDPDPTLLASKAQWARSNVRLVLADEGCAVLNH